MSQLIGSRKVELSGARDQYLRGLEKRNANIFESRPPRLNSSSAASSFILRLYRRVSAASIILLRWLSTVPGSGPAEPDGLVKEAVVATVHRLFGAENREGTSFAVARHLRYKCSPVCVERAHHMVTRFRNYRARFIFHQG